MLKLSNHKTVEVTSFLKLAAIRTILCPEPILTSISSNSEPSKNSDNLSSDLEFGSFASRNDWYICFVSSFDRVEQYEAYFSDCQVTSLPVSSSLFSMITRLPFLSKARRSSLSLVSRKPANSFWIIRSSSPSADGKLAIHSCKYVQETYLA